MLLAIDFRSVAGLRLVLQQIHANSK